MFSLITFFLLFDFNNEFKSYVNKQRYDDALIFSKFCKFSGEFFFYRTVSYYKLKEYGLSKRSAEQALMDTNLPERYRVVLSLLIDEIDAIKERADKMEDISTDMDLVKSRLENAKAGPKTQVIQKRIIAKLDEQIKEAEDELNKAKSESQASQSRPSEARGESGIIEEAPPKGEISSKKLVQGAENWGNLPKKEQIKVAENINRNLPAHIREASENFSKRINSGNKPK